MHSSHMYSPTCTANLIATTSESHKLQFRIVTAVLHTTRTERLKRYVYRVSQEERTKLREGVPYVKLYRYNPKHLYPKLNGYGDNGKRSLKL